MAGFAKPSVTAAIGSGSSAAAIGSGSSAAATGNGSSLIGSMVLKKNASMTADLGLDSESLRTFLSDVKAMYPEADVAFLVFAMQIRNLDEAVKGQLKQVQQKADLRKVYTKRLDQLRELKANVVRYGGKDNEVSETEFLDKCEWWRNLSQAERDEMVQMRTYDVGADDEVFASTSEGSLISSRNDLQISSFGGKPRFVQQDGAINADVIGAHIEKLNGRVQEIDSDREIKMIMLNQTLNKKEQAVNQLTSMLKTTHNMGNSVINNLR
jgi:hypothetical protein